MPIFNHSNESLDQADSSSGKSWIKTAQYANVTIEAQEEHEWVDQ